jgi:hypothetical protein
MCSTWVIVLFLGTYFERDFADTLFINESKSHLLRRHLFCNLRSRMPRPPKALGVHNILHLVSLYFFRGFPETGPNVLELPVELRKKRTWT